MSRRLCCECATRQRDAVPVVRLRSGETRYACRECFENRDYGEFLPETASAFALVAPRPADPA